jgi:hypothetical protein
MIEGRAFFFACTGFCVFLLISNTAPAAATTVVVPGDYATIQGAVDSSSADTIQVKNGDFAEWLVVNRSVTLEADPRSGESFPAFPSVLGLTQHASRLRCSGFRFRGPVEVSSTDERTFESCRFDAGLVISPASGGFTLLRGCLVFGGAITSGMNVAIHGCSFIGGGLTTSAEFWFDVRGNYVAGPATVGIQAASGGAGGSISDNLIEGTTDGLVYVPNFYLNPSISRNEVRDCSGTAYRVQGSTFRGRAYLSDNWARRCGGNGIEASGPLEQLTLSGNHVDTVGGHGILIGPVSTPTATYLMSNTVNHAGRNGLMYTRASGSPDDILSISDNGIFDAGGDGIRAVQPWRIERNVVGRSGGTGVVVDTTRTLGWLTLRSNTAYLNTGSGFRVRGSHADSLDHNLASSNLRYGLEWTSAEQPAIGCNDWYGNPLGPTLGISLSSTDLEINPLFCDLAQDSVTLSAVSLLADAPNCGLIGALGVGCSYPATVEQAPTLARPGLSAVPQPTRGVVRFAWRKLAQPARLEIYDAAGARYWRSDVAPGQQELRWEATDQFGRPLAAGVYFVRLVGPSLDERQRIVLVR